MKRILILGNGMAGGKLVQELIRLGSTDKIIIAGIEGPGIYNRIQLAESLTGETPEGFWLITKEWFAEHGIEALSGHKATTIDRQAKTVVFENGQSVGYDTLVLALGSRPFLPPMQGLEKEGVHALRSKEDAEKIRAELVVKRSILVVGGGLLGLETALELHAAGHTLTVAHAVPGLMERHLDLAAGRYLQKHLEALGVKILTDEICTALLPEAGRVAKAVFRSGQEVETDLVLLSAGIIPETALAKTAGLDVAKGILVDDQLRTSDPSIYAVGECLQWNGRLWGLVSTTFEQARLLSRVLLGEGVEYRPADHPPVRLKAPVFVASLGNTVEEPGDEVFEFKDPVRLACKRVLVRHNKVKGAFAVGTLTEDDPAHWDALELVYSSNQELTQSPGQLLFPTRPADAADPKAWPDNLRVCNCNGVSAGDIRAAIAAGNLTPEAVMKTTRAGTGCSTCRARLRALVEVEAGNTGKKDSAWKKFRRLWQEKEIKGFTPYWIVSYAIDYLLLFCALVVLMTGVIKFPGFLAWLFSTLHDLLPDTHLSVRRLALEAEKWKDFLAWWHDWIGLIMTGGVVLHLIIHWGMMLSFLRSMLKRRKKS